jgi:hypothetical protein
VYNKTEKFKRNLYTFFKISIINLLREILGFCPADWVDDVDTAIESVNPYKYRDKFGLNNGYIYTEVMDLIPSLSNKRLELILFTDSIEIVSLDIL